jgi:hypothetical protein
MLVLEWRCGEKGTGATQAIKPVRPILEGTWIIFGTVVHDFSTAIAWELAALVLSIMTLRRSTKRSARPFSQRKMR